VAELVRGIATRAPVMANRILGVTSRVFSFALDKGLIDAHPCFRMRPPGGKEQKRERVFTDTEIRRAWRVWKEDGSLFSVVARLLLATAQRRGEVAGMKWADIDLEAGLWRLTRTKAGHGNEVPLTPLALELIRSVPRVEGQGLLFTTNGTTPISGWSKFAARTKGATGIDGARLHDLRRTAATNMARLGIPKFTISRVLNHAEGGVTSVYARHGYLEEKRQALQAWETRLRTILAAKDREEGTADGVK
jgi:integrase